MALFLTGCHKTHLGERLTLEWFDCKQQRNFSISSYLETGPETHQLSYPSVIMACFLRDKET